MKFKTLLGVWLLCVCLGAAEPGLLFHTSFNSYVVDADFSAGNKKGSGLPEKDLQLRMFPGPGNKGNSLALGTAENVSYSAEKNIDPRKGTVSMWISPINWDFASLPSIHKRHSLNSNYRYSAFLVTVASSPVVVQD